MVTSIHLAIFVILAVVVYGVHRYIDHTFVNASNSSGGIAIASAVLWLVACAFAALSFVAAIMILFT